MEERDALIGCIIGSILGFWVAQYLSTLSTWSGTPILANCDDLTDCNLIIPFSIVLVLITISVGLWEILLKSRKQR